MLQLSKSLLEWSLFSCVQPMCAVTMFTVQITREHHVGEEDVQECLRRLNCGKSPRRLGKVQKLQKDCSEFTVPSFFSSMVTCLVRLTPLPLSAFTCMNCYTEEYEQGWSSEQDY